MAVTMGALFLVFRSVDLKVMPTLLWSADLVHLLFALIIAFAHFVVGAWRWQQLIYMINGRLVPLKFLFNSYITSFFVSSILPGTITGDIVRIYDTRQETDGTAKSASIVLIERLLGLIILVILGTASWISLEQQPNAIIHFRSWLLPAIGLIIIAALAIWCLGRNRSNASDKIAQWFRVLLVNTIFLPGLMLHKPVQLLRVLAGTLVYQLLSLLIIFEGLQAAHLSISYDLFFAVAPLVSLAIMLPISIQGLGVRESLYVTFFAAYGIDPEAVLAGLSLTYLFGLPFILWGWLLYSQRTKMAVENI